MANDNDKTSVVIDDAHNRGAVAEVETTTTKTTEYWWERDRRPFWLGWLAPLVLLPLLFWWGQTAVRHNIEDDIRGRAVAALEAQGVPGLGVNVKGRDVTLTGALPAGVDVDVVHHAVRSLTGVRHVEEDFGTASAAAAPAPSSTSTSAAPTTTAAPAAAPAAAPTTTAAPAPTTTAAAAAPVTTTTAPAPTTTAAPKTLALRGITFVTGSAQPTDDGFSIIDEAAALLKANPTVKVRIEGHTDNTGDPANNQALSEARATRVRNELIARGIAGDRMTAVGFGASKPIADNNTVEGRAANRRIDFVIVS